MQRHLYSMKASDIVKSYRTFNKWGLQALKNNEMVHLNPQLAALDSYLDEPRFSGLKYRYYATPANREYQRMYREIPLKNVMEYANTMMRPVFTDFTEVNEDREFMKISGKFFYELFIQENIYVTYNVFDGQANYEYKGSNEQENKRLVEAIRRKGGFDIWIKLDEDEYSDNVEFMHIDTSLVVKFPD